MSNTASNDTSCPCGSALDFVNCCEPYITGAVQAPTAEALMRSRYTAYAKGAIAYLKETLAPESRKDYDENSVKEWATQSEWRGLKVLSTKGGQPTDSTGTVEFIATFRHKGKGVDHHEVSHFRRAGTRWYFVEGHSHQHEEGKGHSHGASHEPTQPVVRDTPKTGRNDACPCGSGKKYKKCHGANASEI